MSSLPQPGPAHVAIDLDPSTSSSPAAQRPPTYPPHLESPRSSGSVDWDLFPSQEPSSNSGSSSITRTQGQAQSGASPLSSPTLHGSDDEDDHDLVAWDASSVQRGKRRAEEVYGEVEGAVVDMQDVSPMLRGGGVSVFEDSRRSPKGRPEMGSRAQRRRRLMMYGTFGGILLLLLAAGRHRVPDVWKFERWKSGASAEVFGSGGNGSTITTEDGSQFAYINNL